MSASRIPPTKASYLDADDDEKSYFGEDRDVSLFFDKSEDVFKIRNEDTGEEWVFDSAGELSASGYSIDDNETFIFGTGDDTDLRFDPDLGTNGSFVLTDRVVNTDNELVRYELGSEVVFNEDSQDVDFRVESLNETGMLFIDASENQAVIHGTSDPNYGALFVQGRTSGGGADQDIVATLGEDEEDIQLNGNNTGTVQNVQVQAGNWTSTNAVSPNVAANFRIEGVPTFGTNVAPSSVYAMLVQNRAGDTDWFRITDSGRVDIPSGNVRIEGSNSIEDGSGNIHLTINDAGDLDVERTLSFPNLTGTPTFANHDHSEGGLATIPNAGLTNSSISLTGGNAIDAIGSISLGGSAAVAVSTDGIQTDELDLSITPTWTGVHTFNAGVVSNGTVDNEDDSSRSGSMINYNDLRAVT